jgi:3-hydroxyisobutyrate dehydrogenase-like beta-hydroxyacid dehydrogenase
MSEVTVIGLGPMGHALARALVVSGQRVTVWNRTAARADELVRDGAVLASSAAAAIAASPVTIVCVHDYAVAQQMLDGAAEVLAGRVLIQLSTGTPQDARDSERWAHAQGADYLDGAILATPTQVGRPDTPLFLSGSENALARAEAALNAIAGTRMYLGDAVGRAPAWDLATLSCLFGALLGFVHGARICETEGLAVGDLGVMIAGIAPVLGEMIKDTADDIQAERYENPDSSIKTCAMGSGLFARQAREAGIDDAFPAFAVGLFDRALAAGYAQERLAAIVKVLRASSAVERAGS